MRKYLVLLLLGLIGASTEIFAGSTNDLFENATVLPSVRKVTKPKETVNGATDDTVDFIYRGNPLSITFAQGSWYKWTAPAYGTVTMQFSSGVVVDPYVFKGDSLVYVTTRGTSTSTNGGLWTTDLSFDAALGETFYILVAVNGTDLNYLADNFGFVLGQDLGELPDNFNNAGVIPDASRTFTVEGSNLTSTTEPNEPIHANVSNQKSVWLKWTAPQHSTVKIDTNNSSLDTVLGIYQGSGLATLTEVASNDDQSSGFNKVLQSSAKFTAETGTTYYIAVASKIGLGGRVTVNFDATPRKPDFTLEATTVYAKDTTTATFHAAAQGTGIITYQWQRKAAGQTAWSDLVANATYSGVTGTTLSVANVSFAMDGDQFRSVATDTVGTSYSRPTTLTITEFTPLATTVGGNPILDLANGSPVPTGTTYYVTKLPAGFVLDASTGKITTSPTVTPKPGSYAVSYGTSTNDSNGKPVKGPSKTVLIVVSPLSSDLSGSFEALLEEPSLNIPSGKVELLINATTGAITGKLTSPTEAKIYALKGKLALNSTYDIGTASIAINRGKGLTPYRLDLDINATVLGNPVLSASLKQLNSANVVTATLSGTTSGVKLASYTAISPAPWQGTYNLVLNDPDSGPVNLGTLTPPEGTGYGFVTIPAANGVMTVKGKLGDGTVLTALLSPAADGSYRCYVKPYKTGGFFGGWIEFTPVSGSTAPYKVSGTSDSELYWQKSAASSKDNSYRSGFGPVGITATARLWTAPVGALNTALGLTNGALNSNFTSASLPGADTALLPTSVILDNTNKLVVAVPSANADKFTTKVITSPGAFVGNFILQDGRKVTFEGLLLQQTIPLTAGTVIGEGFFTLPSLTKGNASVTGRIRFVAP